IQVPRWLPRRSATMRSVAVIAALAAFTAITFVARCERDRRRTVEYDGCYEHLRDHVGADETIGYFMSNRSYLLYGKDLSKHVVYIPVTSRDSNEWIGYMRRHGIDVLAAGPAADQKNAWDTFDWLERGRMPLFRVYGRDFHGFPFLYRLCEDVSACSERPPAPEITAR
ncbi:MAG: hypothetical protein MUQ65_06300, partial [Armatimonadetes bacterium]|nr:hypothetical protein [Armatimonadota bacterium]